MYALADAAVAAGLDAGLVACGVASAEPMTDTCAVLEERKRAGLAATMEFTYRNPACSTDPGRIVAGAQALVVGAWRYRTDSPCHPGAAAGRVARYVWQDHYAALEAPSTPRPRCCAPAGTRRGSWPTTTPLSTERSRIAPGLGWFGKNANILVPGHGSWVVLGCGGHGRAAAGERGAGRRRLRTVPALRRRVPDAGDRRARSRRRSALSRLDRSTPRARSRSSSVPSSATASMAATTARKSAPQPPQIGRGLFAPEIREGMPPTEVPAAWVDLLEMLAADDAALLERHGRWYIADRDPRYLRRNASVVLGNVADPADRRVRAALDEVATGADALLAEHATWAWAR